MRPPRALRADNVLSLGTVPEPATFERSYAGREDQVREVRADLDAVVKGCPFADDFVLMASELSANAGAP
jgi:hypothetical protein